MKANSSTATMSLKGKTKDHLLDGGDLPITHPAYPWTPSNSTVSRGTPEDGHSPDYPPPIGTKSSSSSFLVASPSGTQSLTPSPPGTHSDSRGITNWAELSDHTATLDHHVALVVRMDIDRETLDMHASELKLTVLQVSCPYVPVTQCKSLRGL